jgi:hypothetical protein
MPNGISENITIESTMLKTSRGPGLEVYITNANRITNNKTMIVYVVSKW